MNPVHNFQVTPWKKKERKCKNKNKKHILVLSWRRISEAVYDKMTEWLLGYISQNSNQRTSGETIYPLKLQIWSRFSDIFSSFTVENTFELPSFVDETDNLKLRSLSGGLQIIILFSSFNSKMFLKIEWKGFLIWVIF